MFKYYLLLLLAALLFSFLFLIVKIYQRYKGESVKSTIQLLLFSNITITIFFLIKSYLLTKSINFGFSWFSFAMTIALGIISIVCIFIEIKVLSIGDMSMYSTFMMLGSLILPTSIGIIFYNEEFTWLKGFALFLMFFAIIFTLNNIDKNKLSFKAILYYILIFILNGSYGVLFTVHQKNPDIAINADQFMIWIGISPAILAGILLISMSTAKKNNDITANNKLKPVYFIFLPLIYGICNGFGNYLIALGTAPGALGSSVTFPIINGGTILLSTIIGHLLYKEKINKKTIISLILVIISTTLFMFV